MITTIFKRITGADTRILRSQLLRQGTPPEDLVYSGDDEPLTLHIGAYQGGRHVGIVTIVQQSPEFSKGTPKEHPNPNEPESWRIRGMGTVESVRGQGIGASMLQAGMGYVAQQSGAFLWCDARVKATGFYARYGFVVLGEEYHVPDVGPHYFMQRTPTRSDIEWLNLLSE